MVQEQEMKVTVSAVDYDQMTAQLDECRGKLAEWKDTAKQWKLNAEINAESAEQCREKLERNAVNASKTFDAVYAASKGKDAEIESLERKLAECQELACIRLSALKQKDAIIEALRDSLAAAEAWNSAWYRAVKRNLDKGWEQRVGGNVLFVMPVGGLAGHVNRYEAEGTDVALDAALAAAEASDG